MVSQVVAKPEKLHRIYSELLLLSQNFKPILALLLNVVQM